MAEIAHRTWLMEPGDDGWSVQYEVTRDDGETATVRVDCTRTAEQTAKAQNNAAAIESMRNHGGIDAVRLAERAQSPAARGAVYIHVFYDNESGALQQHSSEYGKPHPGLGLNEEGE